MPSSPPSDGAQDGRLRLLVDSYRRLTGRELVPAGCRDAEALRQAVWDAPCAIVAHGTEADPVFFYGNRYALRCFEMDLEAFVKLPSRLSAAPLAREARHALLETVSRQGYVDDYSGMRVSASGRCFRITGGTVWNLTDEAGTCHGQAATFIVRD